LYLFVELFKTQQLNCLRYQLLSYTEVLLIREALVETGNAIQEHLEHNLSLQDVLAVSILRKILHELVEHLHTGQLEQQPVVVV
jgi:hypothetical protein